MEQILSNLKDPAWWFSAIFIAIITSIFAGFAKDKIEKLFSLFSVRLKARLEIEKEKHDIAVDAMKNNEGFLIMAMIGDVTFLLLFIFTSMIFLLSPMIEQIQSSWCAVNSYDISCLINPQNMSLFFTITFGFFSCVTGYKATRFMRVTMNGLRAYIKKNGLPPIM